MEIDSTMIFYLFGLIMSIIGAVWVLALHIGKKVDEVRADVREDLRNLTESIQEVTKIVAGQAPEIHHNQKEIDKHTMQIEKLFEKVGKIERKVK